MNSSLRSTPVERQSTSLGGIDAPSSAVLRRAASFCCFWVSRTRAASTIFCSTVRASALVRRPSTHSLRCCSTRPCSTRVMPAVDSSSLVCEVNCGSGSRTWMTAVMPSSRSSRTGGVLLGLEQAAGVADGLGQRPDQGPLEALAVRAAVHVADRVGEALDGALVAGAPAERDLDLGAALDVGLHHAVGVGGVLLVRALAGDQQDAGDRLVAGRGEELHHVGEAVAGSGSVSVDRLVVGLVAQRVGRRRGPGTRCCAAWPGPPRRRARRRSRSSGRRTSTGSTCRSARRASSCATIRRPGSGWNVARRARRRRRRPARRAGTRSGAPCRRA